MLLLQILSSFFILSFWLDSTFFKQNREYLYEKLLVKWQNDLKQNLKQCAHKWLIPVIKFYHITFHQNYIDKFFFNSFFTWKYHWFTFLPSRLNSLKFFSVSHSYNFYGFQIFFFFKSYFTLFHSILFFLLWFRPFSLSFSFIKKFN